MWERLTAFWILPLKRGALKYQKISCTGGVELGLQPTIVFENSFDIYLPAYLLTYLCIYVSIYLYECFACFYVHHLCVCVPGAPGGKKRTSHPLYLELKIVVNYLVGGAGNSTRATCAFNC